MIISFRNPWLKENTAIHRQTCYGQVWLLLLWYVIKGSLFFSLVGRCEVFAWRERVGETTAQRRRSSSGSHTLDSLFKEFCCEDTAERRSTSLRINTWTTVSFIYAFLFTVCLFDLYQYANLCNLTENEGTSAPAPDFLFELEYCDQMNARFEKTRAGRDVFYAFHGSRLENFHSIVHNGLHCHLNKVSAVILHFIFGINRVSLRCVICNIKCKTSWSCWV